ncbi:hypothetical protein BMETH_580_1 [methanotrophic bacterial endosymbiont of Bathymodiolus sp.]|nr:hypothetical protein BMETH_580_1 [methanotrophic bacterial endosymbiont of Bathymodiolus sp.]
MITQHYKQSLLLSLVYTSCEHVNGNNDEFLTAEF